MTRLVQEAPQSRAPAVIAHDPPATRARFKIEPEVFPGRDRQRSGESQRIRFGMRPRGMLPRGMLLRGMLSRGMLSSALRIVGTQIKPFAQWQRSHRFRHRPAGDARAQAFPRFGGGAAQHRGGVGLMQLGQTRFQSGDGCFGRVRIVERPFRRDQQGSAHREGVAVDAF